MKPEAGQLTVNDRIAIGKAASFLRFQAAYSVDATESARQEWRSTAEALTDIERRCQPQPSEDADDWVILDPVKYAGHVLRKNIDFTNTRTGWEPISIWGGDTIGGVMNDYKGERVLFRCRRSDLPSKVEQPEQWPKYYMAGDRSNSIAFVRRDDEKHYTPVMHDGTELRQQPWFGSDNHRLEFTEAEAMALLNKPQPQSQKTRVRLWMTHNPNGSIVMASPIEKTGDWQEIHHDSEGFYVEEPS